MPNIDTGNTAFMLLCTSLVMLMTPPGLAFFYGGLGRPQERAGHNDPELCVDGVDDRFVVGVWILGLL